MPEAKEFTVYIEGDLMEFHMHFVIYQPPKLGDVALLHLDYCQNGKAEHKLLIIQNGVVPLKPLLDWPADVVERIQHFVAEAEAARKDQM